MHEEVTSEGRSLAPGRRRCSARARSRPVHSALGAFLCPNSPFADLQLSHLSSDQQCAVPVSARPRLHLLVSARLVIAILVVEMV